jgi:hypothetical protein
MYINMIIQFAHELMAEVTVLLNHRSYEEKAVKEQSHSAVIFLFISLYPGTD